MVKGRACLVDGTITPCWSYGDHPELWSRTHGTTGFNARPLSLLGGTAIYISDPISALRAPIERVIALFTSWRMFHTDYRHPITPTATRMTPPEDCSSSQLHGGCCGHHFRAEVMAACPVELFLSRFEFTAPGGNRGVCVIT
jgi:hypothetical protein